MPEKKVRNAAPVILILLALLACVPVVSVLVASASAMGTVANGGKTAGVVTVTSCGQHWLVVPQCRGDFTYSGSGAGNAQPSIAVADVPLANDVRVHDRGARVAANLDTSSGRAYVSGAWPIVIGVVAILVLLFVLAATFATLSRVIRRHQVVLPGPILTFVLAAGLAVLLILPLADHTATSSAGGTPAAVASR